MWQVKPGSLLFFLIVFFFFVKYNCGYAKYTSFDTDKADLNMMYDNINKFEMWSGIIRLSLVHFLRINETVSCLVNHCALVFHKTRHFCVALLKAFQQWNASAMPLAINCFLDNLNCLYWPSKHKTWRVLPKRKLLPLSLSLYMFFVCLFISWQMCCVVHKRHAYMFNFDRVSSSEIPGKCNNEAANFTDVGKIANQVPPTKVVLLLYIRSDSWCQCCGRNVFLPPPAASLVLP